MSALTETLSRCAYVYDSPGTNKMCRMCPYKGLHDSDLYCRVFLRNDAATSIRKCVKSMEHKPYIAPAECYHGTAIANDLEFGCAHWRKAMKAAASFLEKYDKFSFINNPMGTYKGTICGPIYIDESAAVDTTSFVTAMLFKPRAITKEDIEQMEHTDTAVQKVRKEIEKEWIKQPVKKFTEVKSIEVSADHRTVVVIWADGDKTIVQRSENDPDDIYMAFTAALAKKIYGSNSAIKQVIDKKVNQHLPKVKAKDTEDIGKKMKSAMDKAAEALSKFSEACDKYKKEDTACE